MSADAPCYAKACPVDISEVEDFLGSLPTFWAETFWADFLGKAGKVGLAQKVDEK